MDRIANDMRDMARSYGSSASGEPMMQDSPGPEEESKGYEDGEEGNARDMLKKQDAANDPSEDSPAKPEEGKDADFNSSVMDNKQLGQTINGAFQSDDEKDGQRHDEMMASQKKQTDLLSGTQGSVSSMSGMMYDKEHGPDVSPYQRKQEDMGKSVAALATQQAQEHEELMRELQKMRYAIMNVGGMGGMGGMFGGGGGRSGRPPGPRPPRPPRPQSRWARLKGAVSGAFRGPGGTKKKLALAVVAGGGALWAGNKMMGDSPGEAKRPAGEWDGLGSISESNESSNGVNTISSGRGDNGGVSYGAHQLATNTGSMSKFLASDEGAAFAPAFDGMSPGTEEFDARYAEVADDYEVEFAQAQSNYIKRTHYEPMVENVSAATGVDLSKRGPAVQEMLYSTGVQYGPETGVVTAALKGRDIGSMSDAQIVSTVQAYKGQTTGQYFKSSSAEVQDSVRARAGREQEQLLALDSQHKNGLLAPSKSNPLQELQGDVPSSLLSTSTVAGAAVMGAGALTMARGTGSPPTPDAPPRPAPNAGGNDGRTTTARDRIAAINERRRAARAAARPPPVPPAGPPAVPPAGPPAKPGMLRRAGGKLLPGISLGLTAMEVYSIVNNEEMSGGEKAGAVTDIAGGLGGAWAGATAGASVGAAGGALLGSVVPVLGTAIGGTVGGFVGGLAGSVGGYFAGEAATKSAREWVGGLFGDDEAEVESIEQDKTRATGSAQELMDDPEVSGTKKKILEARKKADAMRKRAQEANPDYKSPFLTQIDDPSVSQVKPGGIKGSEQDPKKTADSLDSLTGALASVPVLAGVVGAAKQSANDSASSESGPASFGVMKSVALAALPVVGAIQSATSAMSSWFGGDPEESTVKETEKMKAANAQELFDSELVPAMKDGASKKPTTGEVASKTQTQIKAAQAKIDKDTPAANDERKKNEDKEGEGLGTVMKTLLTTLVGEDMVKVMESGGPANQVPEAVRSRMERSVNTGEDERTWSERTYADYSSPKVISQPKAVNSNKKDDSNISNISQNKGTSSVSNVTTKAVSETETTRSQHDSVQKVLMLDPTIKKSKHKNPELKPSNAGPTSTGGGGSDGRSIRSGVDESPVVVSDFGLALLNTGFI